MGGGGGSGLHLTLYCHHKNDFCIQIGSDESHYNLSFILRGKVTGQCPQATAFKQPKRGIEPTSSAYRPNALPLGQPRLTVADVCDR